MVAFLAVIVLGILGIAAVNEDLMPQAGASVGVAALLLGYVAYAQRRTSKLLREEATQSGEEADREFARLSQGPAMTTGVTLRWRPRTYLMHVLALALLGIGLAWGRFEESWIIVAFFAAPLLLLARALFGRLRSPEVLRVGPAGIEDEVKFGLIPWQDVESASLYEDELKGVKVASLTIGVKDPEPYVRRLGPLARLWLRAETLGGSDAIRIQLQTLDMAPSTLFRIVRGFHERTLPAGAIFSLGNYYQVDIAGGKLRQAMAEADKEFEALKASPGTAPTARLEELLARVETLGRDELKASRERGDRYAARIKKAKPWLVLTIGLLVALVILVLLGRYR